MGKCGEAIYKLLKIKFLGGIDTVDTDAEIIKSGKDTWAVDEEGHAGLQD
jgi:hypothetical protein